MALFTRRTMPVRLAALSIILLAGLAGAPVQALDKVAAGIGFTLRCAGLMLSDPDEHVAICNPVMPPPRLESLVEMGPDNAPAPPAPVPPPPPEEPACAEEPCLPDDCFVGALVRGERIALVAALQLAQVEDCPRLD